MTYCNRPSLPQKRRLAKQAQKIDANHFFNLLIGPQLDIPILRLLFKRWPFRDQRMFRPKAPKVYRLSCRNSPDQ